MRKISQLAGAVALATLLGAPAHAQNEVQRQHDADLRNNANSYTKYYRNSDNYPKPFTAPVTPSSTSSNRYSHEISQPVYIPRPRVQSDTEYFQEKLRQSAAGDVEATLRLAHCYYSGDGVAKNPAEAYRLYFLIAAKRPHAEAMAAAMKYAGLGTRQNQTEALREMKHAAAAGDREAANWVAALPDWALRTPQSDWTSLSLAKSVASRDWPQVVVVAEMVLYGHNAPQDAPRGVQFMRQAAQAGNAEAQYHLGRAYLEGIGVTPDLSEAQRWLLSAAAGGRKEPAYFLALLAYMNTPAHPADMLTFRRYAARSAQVQPNCDSFYLMAVAESQLGHAAKQREWLQKAFDRKNLTYFMEPADRYKDVRAELQLALMEWGGQGGPVDDAAGLKHLEEAAAQRTEKPYLKKYLAESAAKGIENGDPQALYLLGQAYRTGAHGLSANPSMALKLLHAAAAKGHARAKAQLAKLAN